jgi:hypothetical protein
MDHYVDLLLSHHQSGGHAARCAIGISLLAPTCPSVYSSVSVRPSACKCACLRVRTSMSAVRREVPAESDSIHPAVYFMLVCGCVYSVCDSSGNHGIIDAENVIYNQPSQNLSFRCVPAPTNHITQSTNTPSLHPPHPTRGAHSTHTHIHPPTNHITQSTNNPPPHTIHTHPGC